MLIPSGNHTIIALHRPDLREKLFFFISGIIISVPLTLFIDRLVGSLGILLPVFHATFFSTAILAPVVEEFAKAYPLFYRHGETQRSIFTLGFLVGLGFGISEFLIYVFGMGVPAYIRVPGLFFHAASTSITAYGIATKRPAPFYLIAVLLHFTNNFSALFGTVWLVGGIAAVAIAYFLSWRFYHLTSDRFVMD
jgi:RsiW-degrading membrane proteinase PrsW (M82 family)